MQTSSCHLQDSKSYIIKASYASCPLDLEFDWEVDWEFHQGEGQLPSGQPRPNQQQWQVPGGREALTGSC